MGSIVENGGWYSNGDVGDVVKCSRSSSKMSPLPDPIQLLLLMALWWSGLGIWRGSRTAAAGEGGEGVGRCGAGSRWSARSRPR
eukprot:1174341-Prorocentrum_minimum.AAC.2